MFQDYIPMIMEVNILLIYKHKNNFKISIVLTNNFNILCMNFWIVVLIFIVNCNTMFWPLYPLAFLVYLGMEMIQPEKSFLKLDWFPRLNHFHTQINKGHLRKTGGYSGGTRPHNDTKATKYICWAEGEGPLDQITITR